MFWKNLGLMFLVYWSSLMLLVSLGMGIGMLVELKNSAGWKAFGEGLLGVVFIVLSLLLSYALVGVLS